MLDRKYVHGMAQTFGLTYMTFVYFIVWKEKLNEQGIEYKKIFISIVLQPRTEL